MNKQVNVPKVSIIVPVYNVEEYLDQCVNSLINQSLKEIEIILVNDGSKDNSGNICDQFEAIDKRVIVINQKNQGLSGARNTGLEFAHADYVVFLDSDDWLEHDTCEIAYNIAIQEKYDLVFWQMIKEYRNSSMEALGIFRSSKSFKGKEVKNLHRRIAGPIGKEKEMPNLIDSIAPAWGKLYNLKLIKENNIKFIDTQIIGSEDIFFNFQYFYYLKSAFYLDKHLIHYRKDNVTSLTKSHGSTLFPRFLKLFEYMEAEIDNKNLSLEFREALNNRVSISMMNVGLSEVSPRNKKNFIQKIRSLRSYLNSPVYRNSYINFSLKFLPIHWKIFYWLCRKRNPYGIYILLKFMRLFIK